MFKRLRESSNSTATPSSSPAFSSNSSPHTHHVPPTTPRKRDFQASLSSPELTPSQKRTKIMQEALRESTTPPDASASRQTLTASQRSQKRLDDIKQALSPNKQPSNISQLVGNHSDNTSVQHGSLSCPRSGQYSASTSYGQSSDSLSTSIQPTNSIDQENADEKEDASLWALLTPPSSSLEIGSLPDEHGINVGNVSSTDNNVDPIAMAWRWRSGDPENPFDDSVLRKQATNSTSTSNPSVSASTSLQHSTSLSADTASSLISSLSGIPDYMRKLERKVIAAEKGNKAKAKRVHDLEQEVGRLQEEKRALQESYASKSKGR